MTSLRLRRGTALFIVLIVCAGFAVMAIAASERMFGMKQLTGLELGKQRAAAAAEAVAAMVESRLMDSAADYAKLTVPVDDTSDPTAKPWWGLKGCVYKGTDGQLHGPGYDADAEPLWVNGCLVRWIVEPVRVYSQAWSGTPSKGKFVVNPPRDPNDVNTWKVDAKFDANGNTALGDHDPDVADFYHFRVIAQAYALKNPDDTTATPWSDAGSHVAAAQSLRVLQIQSLQLFRYALFYASPSPIGDLDFQTGGTIWVQKGAVHSNGAIYIRGGESSGFNQKNWHVLASGDWGVDAPNAGQSIFLGEKDRPVTITGVSGIFRLNKTGNNLAANYNLFYNDGGTPVRMNPLRPMDIPTDASRFAFDDKSGSNAPRLDLNGDQADSNRHRFNGVNFTRANDSRSPQEFVKAFSNYARDANNGATIVRTLQNIPELGGRPFEPQVLAIGLQQRLLVGTDRKNPLYGQTTGNVLGRLSRSPGPGLAPLWYTTDPTGTAGRRSTLEVNRDYGVPFSQVAVGGGVRQVFSDEMRLWWNPAMTDNDVLNPSQEIALRDQIPGATITVPNDGSYTLGLSPNSTDEEKIAVYDNLTATLPTIPPVASGVLSFPGVPFTMPAGYPSAGLLWNPGFYGTGFSPREVKGYYLQEALFGNLATSGSKLKQQRYYQDSIGAAAPLDIGRSGIVIREHRWQQRPRKGSMSVGASPMNTVGDEKLTAWNRYWQGGWIPDLPDAFKPLNPADAGAPEVALDVLPIPRPTLRPTPTAEEKLAYVQYLCSQYTVLFCGRNITAPFFGQILSQTDFRDFIVSEDEFVDPRESGYMWGIYGANGDINGTHGGTPTDDFFQYEFFDGVQPASYPAAAGSETVSRDYRQNVLTIHMRAFQLWLRNTPMSELGYPGSGQRASQRFTGVLYTHRTRRSDTLHPLLTPEFDWPGFRHITANMEDQPERLLDQSHFRAFWFTEVASATPPRGLDKATLLGKGYPPVNFPWNWREPSGPLETTRCATRLRGQTSDPAETDPTWYRIFWNHTTTTSNDALGTSGFTYITPQRFYLWGNYCYKITNITSESLGRQEIDSNIDNITPSAVFADNYTMQSVNWRDESSQSLPTSNFGHPPGMADSTCHFFSMVINNSPNSRWNCGSFGSAGQEGTFRMIENWGYQQTHYWWSGSQVVMNMGRYHHSGHQHLARARADARRDKDTGVPGHMGVGTFHTSTNHYIFNTNLFKREGRPPLAPSGVNATRVVNQVSYFGN